MRIGDGLYEHLRDMVVERWQAVEALHAEVERVACWFDYSSPDRSDCSPYVGLVRELAALTERASNHNQPSPHSRVLEQSVHTYWF